MKWNATENFDDLLQIVDTYLDTLELGVALSDGFQPTKDLDEVAKFITGLPAAITGFTDGVDALKTLTKEQRDAVALRITERQSFPDTITDDAVDKITLGAIYFAQGTLILLNKNA